VQIVSLILALLKILPEVLGFIKDLREGRPEELPAKTKNKISLLGKAKTEGEIQDALRNLQSHIRRT